MLEIQLTGNPTNTKQVKVTEADVEAARKQAVIVTHPDEPLGGWYLWRTSQKWVLTKRIPDIK